MTKSWKQSMLMLSLYFLSVFHQVLLATNSVSSKQQVRCHHDESSALFQFKQSFSINRSVSGEPYAYPKLASWKLNESGTINDCCSWDGVECSEDTGHVIGLHLSNSFLYGPINNSSSLFLLVHLQSLDLSGNDFMHSQIPSGFASLSLLTSLNLSASQFSGQIPKEISQLTQLASLDLSINPLQLQRLSFEHLVQGLKMLKVLSLSWVNISSQVPHSLANLTSLSFLDLEECGLTGEFPSGIFQLPELQFLSVNGNDKLTGYLPEFHTVSRLEHLQLSDTSFSGHLPVSIGNLKSLIVLDLKKCNFSESLPASLGNLTELTTLHLAHNRFKGNIPSLASLSELRKISLSNFEFDGGILPNWLGKLAKLTDVCLTNTNLHGVMPSSLSNLTQLTNIQLDSNRISGPIPSWLMNLTQLTRIVLSNNSLQGPIPATISQLEHITHLNLYKNEFSGIVDADVFLNLKKLKFLQLSRNNITFMDTKNYTNATLPQFQFLGLTSCNLKVFPYFLRSQNELRFLSLAENHIGSQIPKWFWNSSKETLEAVLLKDNLLTGFEKYYPHALPWVGVRILDLRCNMLQGSLPIPPLNTMIYLVRLNRLIGEIPPLICQASSLRILDLSLNNMTGIIPPCLGNQIDSLSILMLRSNNFWGTIPNSFVKGSKLKVIDISKNQLEGQLPRSLANCSMLQFVNVADNSVDDNFPFWLGILSHLQILILRSNKFHGEIKSSLTTISDQFPKVRTLDLSDNYFTGDMPEDYMIQSWTAMKISDSNVAYLQEKISIDLHISYFANYSFTMSIINRGVMREYDEKTVNIPTILDLSSNRLVGKIPATIGQLQGLQFLNLSNNDLNGSIPLSLVNLTNLESLDLSRNRLSGEIPQQLAQLTFLASLNVSHNRLIGPIPQGKQFSTFQNNSYEGNLGLCGEPLSKKCGNSQVPWIVPSNEEDDDDSLFPTAAVDWIIVFLGSASGLVVGLIFGQYLTNRHHDWFVKKFGHIRKLK